MTIRIGITGAAGRMGRTLIEAISLADGLTLAAAIERPESTLLGADSGELAGQGKNGVAVVGSLAAVITDIDVLIDFSVPEATMANLALCSAPRCRHGDRDHGLYCTSSSAILRRRRVSRRSVKPLTSARASICVLNCWTWLPGCWAMMSISRSTRPIIDTRSMRLPEPPSVWVR